MRLKGMILAAVVLLAAGCGNKNVLTDPAFQPQLTNETDNFAFQASNLDGVTQTLQWTWQNTQTNANVNHSSAITSGTAILTITDRLGVQQHMQPLAPSGTTGIGSGSPGAWTIRLALTDVRGTINFEVQTAP